VVISRAVDMPEGATLSDGDDDRDGLDANDPHRALGDIIFDDYKIDPIEVEPRASQQVKILCKFLSKIPTAEFFFHKIDSGSQSYDCEIQRQRCKNVQYCE
jgi:hypothetical protein